MNTTVNTDNLLDHEKDGIIELYDLVDMWKDDNIKIANAVKLILENDVEGEHHKQWVLTQVLKELCGQEKFDRIMKSYDENENYGGWDKGIAP